MFDDQDSVLLEEKDVQELFLDLESPVEQRVLLQHVSEWFDIVDMEDYIVDLYNAGVKE